MPGYVLKTGRYYFRVWGGAFHAALFQQRTSFSMEPGEELTGDVIAEGTQTRGSGY